MPERAPFPGGVTGEASGRPADDGAAYEGHPARALAAQLRVPQVVVHERVTSTQDAAHALAEAGAVAGTVVLADAQTAGRGRGAKAWSSEAGAGLWLTLIERPDDPAALDVLSLRLGLAAASVLDEPAGEPVRLKWPNDLYLASGKLAGILVETRWRELRIEWVAIGIGVNVRLPEGLGTAAALRTGTDRVAVLRVLVPALRAAAAQRGALTAAELDAFAQRDMARGRMALAPVPGRVAGITPRGELRIGVDGQEVLVRSGSLVLQEEG